MKKEQRWAIWVDEITTVQETFASEEDADRWVEELVKEPDLDNLWIRTGRGFRRLSSINEFRIGRFSS